MCKKLPVGKFKQSKNLSIYTDDNIKNYDENSDYGAILEVDVEYPKELTSKHKDLQFLPQRKKINKIEKLVTTLEDKENYVVHIATLKQALNHGLKLKKVHRVITFKQEAWLKPYIDMNTKLRADAKNDFEKDFFKLMNNSVFGKTMENVRNYRDIKLVTNNAQRKKHVSEPNYMTSKHFSEDLMPIEMRKTKVIMNKPVYLEQAIPDISKTLMYEFYYDYLKPKYGHKVKLCYMDTDSFILHIETEDFCQDIANDVNKWFDTSAYNKRLKRPLPIRINRKVIGKFKDELDGQIMTELWAPKPKTYAFTTDDNKETKRAKSTKKFVIKKDPTHNDYKDSVLNGKTILRSQLRFRSDHHYVFTEEMNKIAISPNYDKRLQTLDAITTYPIGTSAFKYVNQKCQQE